MGYYSTGGTGDAVSDVSGVECEGDNLNLKTPIVLAEKKYLNSEEYSTSMMEIPPSEHVSGLSAKFKGCCREGLVLDRIHTLLEFKEEADNNGENRVLQSTGKEWPVVWALIRSASRN